MDKTIRKFSSFEEVKADEYRYWQSVPPAARIEATFQLSVDLYRMKGVEPDGAALKELLSALNARAVRYVVVGSYALAVHAQPRATGDLDVLVDTDPENAQAVFTALAEFGAPLQGLTPKDFEDPDSIFQIGISPIRIDIIKRISGLDFETVWVSSVPWVIDNEVPARYISKEHFIANKLAVGRLQDLADVSAVMQSDATQKKPPTKE